jgi:hypothetical protein
VFFRHPSFETPASAFDAWLESLLIRPVWEPAPEAGLMGDLDGDQAGDFLEYALGSDLLDAASLPAWRVSAAPPGGGANPVEIVLTARRSIQVDLENSADLSQWEPALPAPEYLSEAHPQDPALQRLTLRWNGPRESRATFFRLAFSE